MNNISPMYPCSAWLDPTCNARWIIWRGENPKRVTGKGPIYTRRHQFGLYAPTLTTTELRDLLARIARRELIKLPMQRPG